MDINLEKIELVKDRTGSTYAEAKEALERADGSVVDAIIDIEEKMNKSYDAVDGGSIKDSPIFAKMKEIVDKGNVTRILISKGDKTIVNFPLTAGVIGAVLVGVIFYALNAIIGFSFMTKTMTMVSIALTNTLYRLAVVILLAPGIGIMEKVVCKMFPEGEEAAAEQADMDRLESRFLEHPTLAIAQSQIVIGSMAEKAYESSV